MRLAPLASPAMREVSGGGGVPGNAPVPTTHGAVAFPPPQISDAVGARVGALLGVRLAVSEAVTLPSRSPLGEAEGDAEVDGSGVGRPCLRWQRPRLRRRPRRAS